MKVRDVLTLSTRMFKTRPLRTMLTILGVSVGIGAVLFLVSLGYGLQQVILNRISTADSLLTLDVSSGTSELIKLDSAALEKMRAIPNVVEVSPLAILTSQMTVNELTGGGFLQGVDQSFFRLSGVEAAAGTLFTDPGAYETVISSAAVQLFGLTPEDALGKKMIVTIFLPTINEDGQEEAKIIERADEYTIVGVTADEAQSYAFVPIKTIEDINIPSFDQVKVKVADSGALEIVRQEVINQGFFVSALLDTIEQARKIFKIVQIVLGLFGLVALIVSAIGMFNTMTVTLLERINEIGIMRAVGVGKADILKLFISESVIMGFLGGVGGVTIGYLGGTVANLAINILAKNFGGEPLSLFVRPLWFIAIIILFSTVIGFFTGVFPARRAAKMHPLDALRYK